MEEQPDRRDDVQREVVRFPYRPPPETVARIAEFLSLATTLNAPEPQQLADVAHQLAALRREIARLNGELAVFEAYERKLQEDARAEAPNFRRANQLALQLATELPVSLWRAVQQTMRHEPNQPVPISQIWDTVAVVHEAYGSEGKITGAEQFWSGPGVSRPKGP